MQSPREYAVTEGKQLIEQMKARRAALDMPVAEMAKAGSVTPRVFEVTVSIQLEAADRAKAMEIVADAILAAIAYPFDVDSCVELVDP